MKFGENMQSCPRSTPVCDEGAERKIVKNQIINDQATEAVRQWWHNRLMARDLKRNGQITECRLDYAPYWKIYVKIDGYVDVEVDRGVESFTQVKREKKTVTGSMAWTRIACIEGDIGIDHLKNSDVEVLPYDGDLDHLWVVTVSKKEALDMGCRDVENVVTGSIRMDRIISRQIDVLPLSAILIFYPLWMVKYTYAEHTYGATVDGVTGDILAGLAPGDPLLRKASQVAAMISTIIIVILIAWMLVFRQDAWVLVLILSGMCLCIAFNASHYHKYGSEIRRGISHDTYGPPDYEEKKNHNVDIKELKVKIISSVRVG
jgi:hypothetical protein